MKTNDKQDQQVEFEDNEVRVTAGNPMTENGNHTDKTHTVHSEEVRYENADDIYGED